MNAEAKIMALDAQLNRVVAAYTTHVQQTNHSIRELQQNTIALARIVESLQTAVQQLVELSSPTKEEEQCH